MPLFEIYRMIRDLLDARERRNALLLFLMMLAMGVFEAIGVASLMPFISVVASPEVVYSNKWLSAIYLGLGFDNTDDFLILLGVVVFIMIVGSLTFKALTHWAIARYSFMRNYTLSSRLLRGYLNRPYSFFLNRHSADLGKTILSEVGQVINSAILPSLYLLSGIVVAVCITILVVIVEPVVAITAAAFLSGAYGLVYLLLRRNIGHLGIERLQANKERFRVAQESLGGIKDVKVLGLEDGYIRSFQGPAKRFSRVQVNNNVIGEIPRFFLEGIIMGGMLLLVIILLKTNKGDLGAVLPLVGLYAFAGMRLLPALQRIYSSLTKLRFGKPALELLHNELVETEQAGIPAAARAKPPESGPVPVTNNIQLKHVYYNYPGSELPALCNLSLEIRAKTTVGLVGTSGAGKSTAVDVILGLLEPGNGQLKVDGQTITGSKIRAWQRNIGFVPQSIFLADDTVAANIAFGIEPELIDYEAVERAASIAELHEFVTGELPQSYKTMIGERGVRLSGGQRQRIGIARALYHDPEVLVLDEATSALDNLTERAVIDAVHNLGHRKTIILIAHRLSTVKDCDTIFMLEHGELVAQGSYDELIQCNESFRAMAAK